MNIQIKNGSVVTDGLVKAKVIGEGKLKFGKKMLDCWKVLLLSSHQMGLKSLMPKNNAILLNHNKNLKDKKK